MLIELNEFTENLGEGLAAYLVTNEGEVSDIIVDGNDFPNFKVEVSEEPDNDELGDYFIGVYETNSNSYQIFVTNAGLEPGDQAI